MKNFFTQIAQHLEARRVAPEIGHYTRSDPRLPHRIIHCDSWGEQRCVSRANGPSGSGGLGDLLSLFTGGAFTRASIFALGIMPYISASIIIQLLGIAVPAVQKMQAEGESGRKKINQYTRFLTIAITLVQAPGYLATTVVEFLVQLRSDDVLVVQCGLNLGMLHVGHHVAR